jgi:SAM-dependent methyltransferase
VVQGKQYSEILDIGCGDGSISTPLLNSNCRLTLLDVSPGMLSIARSRIPEELSSRVKFVNEDFMQVPFEQNFFDLVICVGVLAHVVSPKDLIGKIASVLKPGGTLILECTNGHHFLDRLNQLRNHVAWLFHPPKYKMNILSATAIRKTAEEYGFNPAAEFRYGLPLPGTGRFYSADGAYTSTRSLFGDIDQSQSMAGYPAYFSLCPRINRRNRSYNCKRLLILSQSAYSTAVCCPNAICQRPSLFTKYPRHLQHFSVQRSVFLAHHRRVSERPHLPRFTCKRVVVSRACSHTSSQY